MQPELETGARSTGLHGRQVRAQAMNTVFHRLGPVRGHSRNRSRRHGPGRPGDRHPNRPERRAQARTDRHLRREARDILEAEQTRRGVAAAVQSDQHARSRSSTSILPNESGYFLVAMEYLDGENLSDVIARGAVPVDRAVTIASELCAFLDAAHNFEAVIDGQPRRSVVHGDLKPQNVRITSDRRGQGARLRHRQGLVTQPQGHAQRLRHQALSLSRAARRTTAR